MKFHFLVDVLNRYFAVAVLKKNVVELKRAHGNALFLASLNTFLYMRGYAHRMY